MDWLNSRLNLTKERVSKLEDISKKTTQNIIKTDKDGQYEKGRHMAAEWKVLMWFN